MDQTSLTPATEVYEELERTRRRVIELERRMRERDRTSAALREDYEDAKEAVVTAQKTIRSLRAQLSKANAEDPRREEIETVFRYWLRQTGRNEKRYKLTKDRRDAVRARLNEGRSLEEIKLAIDGLVANAFERNGHRFDDLELVCRDGKHFERYRDLAEKPPVLPPPSSPPPPPRPKIEDALQSQRREALRAALEVTYEAAGGLVDEMVGLEYWPCPVCRAQERDPDGIYVPLVVNLNPIAKGARLVWCNTCAKEEHVYMQKLGVTRPDDA